jgi:hypothetical protein
MPSVSGVHGPGGPARRIPRRSTMIRTRATELLATSALGIVLLSACGYGY